MSKALQVSPELKPCPLDGGKLYMNEYTNKGKHWAACKCGFRGPMKDNEQEAIEAVNSRTTTDAVPKGVVAWRCPECAQFWEPCQWPEPPKEHHTWSSEGKMLDCKGKMIPLGVLPFDAGEGMNSELARVLRRIIDELPTNRDWLDPDLERDSRAALSGRQAATWQPISNAPRDCSRILADTKDWGVQIISSSYGEWTGDGDIVFRDSEIFGWMPLPSSPELNRGNGT